MTKGDEWLHQRKAGTLRRLSNETQLEAKKGTDCWGEWLHRRQAGTLRRLSNTQLEAKKGTDCWGEWLHRRQAGTLRRLSNETQLEAKDTAIGRLGDLAVKGTLCLRHV